MNNKLPDIISQTLGGNVPMNTTKTAQFTPGPWVVKHDNQHDETLVQNEHTTVATVWRTEPAYEVNATLIAAAPAMYEALQIMVRAANVDETDPLVMFASIERAKAALELAEGERYQVEQPLMRTQAEGR